LSKKRRHEHRGPGSENFFVISVQTLCSPMFAN